MSDSTEENAFDRLDRKIGMAYSRFWGLILIGIAVAIAYFTLDSATFTVATHWPGLAVPAFLLVLARFSYGSQEGMLDLLSDTRSSKARSSKQE